MWISSQLLLEFGLHLPASQPAQKPSRELGLDLLKVDKTLQKNHQDDMRVETMMAGQATSQMAGGSNGGRQIAEGMMVKSKSQMVGGSSTGGQMSGRTMAGGQAAGSQFIGGNRADGQMAGGNIAEHQTGHQMQGGAYNH